MAATTPLKPDGSRQIPPLVRALLVVGLLYIFLGAVRLLEGGIKGFGSDFTDALFGGVSNPLAGLAVGILGTVLVQSSSVSTTTIVGLVASGILNVESAVPMIMGANIGTTVTNTLVALAHMRQSVEFRLAFTAATMHDFFNLMAVAILLPLEMITGVLSKTAGAITEAVSGGDVGGSFNSPIKGAVKWLGNQIESLIEPLVGEGNVYAAALLIVGIALIFVTLTLITKNMRALVARRIEQSLNAALAKSGLIGLVVGMIMTIAVQSSSITTSILIPLVASGILVVRNAYPITLGANVGTTITALLAALGTGEVDGMTIAFVHTLFNASAIAILYPWRKIRYIPVQAAERLADIALERKWLALAYTGTMFVLIPIALIALLR
ncbi:MAG: sodium dependent phosphate transporter [bacterium]|nr:sodium dependent phosphate transporter [bacterium]